MRNMMISKKLFTGIVFVICTFAYSQTYAQMTATIVWDEIKQIASENGFKISAIINQSAEGIDIEEFSLINKASENNEFERLEIELVDIALLERSDGSVEIRPDYDQEITIKVYEGNGVSSFVINPLSDNTNMIISGKDRKSTLWTPVTSRSRMPSSAWKKKNKKNNTKKTITKKKKNK